MKILFIIFSILFSENLTYHLGAIIRGDQSKKEIAIVFTGDSYADGADHILKTLKEKNVKASFFFTGNFYRDFPEVIRKLKKNEHYLGAHSDKHLLYCSWENRDSLLVSEDEFKTDLENNYEEMKKFGIEKNEALFFLPPYEWYNETISKWTNELGLTLINFTSGTKSHADYTTPGMKNYISSDDIYKSIINYEENSENGLNGFILLIHIGTAPEREDKLYFFLGKLIDELTSKGYSFMRIDELLKKD